MKNKKSNPGNGEDEFYMENGLVVFTRSYHLKRGYCCKSGCRHCPYSSATESEDKGKKLS
ncbi:MAG: DUF5522 domain-containing protein [Cyclobacteriaceae bacterium]